MMPPAEYSGLRLPIAGAAPSILSSGLDGPNDCSHASATTCGAISKGMTKQNTTALRPRISVSPTHSATAVPTKTARSVPPNAVSRLWPVAVHVVGLASTRAIASVDSVPPGAMPSATRRASGSSDSTATTPTSHVSSA
jgi:hypothetical protein